MYCAVQKGYLLISENLQSNKRPKEERNATIFPSTFRL